MEAGLAKSGILRMPPDFCANAPWPPSQTVSAVLAATAILHQRLIIALRAVGVTWTQYRDLPHFPPIFEASIAASIGLGNDQSPSASKRRSEQGADGSRMFRAVNRRSRFFRESAPVAAPPRRRSFD